MSLDCPEIHSVKEVLTSFPHSAPRKVQLLLINLFIFLTRVDFKPVKAERVWIKICRWVISKRITTFIPLKKYQNISIRNLKLNNKKYKGWGLKSIIKKTICTCLLVFKDQGRCRIAKPQCQNAIGAKMKNLWHKLLKQIFPLKSQCSVLKF